MKFTKKNTVILSTILVVVFAGGGGAYYVLTSSSKGDDKGSQNTVVTPPSSEEAKLTTIAADPLKHADEDTSVKGIIRNTADGKYIIMSTNPQPDQPAGMVVDFETNKIDPSQYVGTETAVTLKGKSVKTETPESLTVIFVVSSLNP